MAELHCNLKNEFHKIYRFNHPKIMKYMYGKTGLNKYEKALKEITIELVHQFCNNGEYRNFVSLDQNDVLLQDSQVPRLWEPYCPPCFTLFTKMLS